MSQTQYLCAEVSHAGSGRNYSVSTSSLYKIMGLKSMDLPIGWFLFLKILCDSDLFSVILEN